MHAKPESCRGCPLYGDGHGFVPDEIIPGATVAVLAQNPGADEERDGRPMVGKTGQMMNREYLPLAGLTRGQDVSVLNVLKCRWAPDGRRRSNDLPPAPLRQAAVAHCVAAHLVIPPTTRVGVAQGALAWQTIGGPGSITDWRGFPQVWRGIPWLATVHLADLYRNPSLRLPTRQDWRKVPRMVAGTWPSPVPLSTRPVTAHELEAWVEQARQQPYLVVDTEYVPATRWLWLWGMGGPTMPTTLQVERAAVSPGVWAAAGQAMRSLASTMPIVYQNAMADLPVLTQAWGVGHAQHRQVEDCMLLHAVLWSELPHDLGFLASLYGRYAKLKHLAKSDPLAYHQGDLLATLDVWAALHEEALADPAAYAVYRTQSLALIPIVLKAEAAGIQVNRARVESALVETQTVRARAATLAQAYAGWPINVGSDAHLKMVLYGAERLPLRRQKTTRQPTIDTDAVAALRATQSPQPDVDEEAAGGLTWEAVVARVEEGAHPLLEARVLYAAAQQLESHYLHPAAVALEAQGGRVYPHIMLHTQATGRWSITNPHAQMTAMPHGLPLQQLPRSLRDIVQPDPGDTWVSWDWSGIEEVLLGALSGETVILDAVASGADLHAAQAETLFGAKARGREDYRTFTKRYKYRLYYLGEPRSAGNIPGAARLGLAGPQLVTLSRQLLSTMPRLAAYRDRITATLAQVPRSRTFMGRPRTSMAARGPGQIRELWNHLFQGGVADILNTTVVAIAAALPWARLVYTSHDAGTFAVPSPRAEVAQDVIREIVTRPITVESRTVRFPAKFNVVSNAG